MPTFASISDADWRAQVESELKGAPFDKSLIHHTAEGIAVQPLYVRAAALPTLRLASAGFGVCVRADAHTAADELAGGADALWVSADLAAGVAASHLVLDPGSMPLADVLRTVGGRHFVWAADPIGAAAATNAASPAVASLADFARDTLRIARECASGTGALVSTLAYHRAGADAADEIALALSTGVQYLRALVEAGLDIDRSAAQIGVQAAVGRDTFGELCKLRALRVCWQKLLAAAGARQPMLPLLHAVASPRTLTRRDPWVNMLRVTTQVFAAALGQATLVTPQSFDAALGPASALGRRVARNTALVLREESGLGRVVDPAAGSYYLETLTDALARMAWERFRGFEREGGILGLLARDALRPRLAAAWQARQDAFAKRKQAITGVSEFANLDEKLPPATLPTIGATIGTALPLHRDAEAFEMLRDRADAAPATIALVTLGPANEHRGRVGFAAGFFAAGGLRTHEATSGGIACLCGSDERYASEAIVAARNLKVAGCKYLLVAGRPGPLETTLRDAGVDDFLYLGCDAVAVLSRLLGAIA